jgi:arylformamidase
MKISDYPPQEPLSAAGARYQDAIMAMGQGITGEEHRYGDDPYQSLAVFRAERASGDVLLFFHGGGWTSGYKEWMDFMAPALTARGVTFVSAGYRLAPQHVFPVGYEDAVRALGWVREHIADFGGDARRIFVGGHSAGGHYAALMAMQCAPGEIAGCLPVSGVYRFGEGSGLSVRPRFLGDSPQAEDAASPVRHVRPGRAPFLIAYGENDFPHLVLQAAQMQQALQAAGVPVQRLVLPGRDHFTASMACGEPDGPWVAPAVSWMSEPRS